jgi:hypothetical protein
MTHIKGIILIIITGLGQIFAQNSDFYSLKDVQKFRFDRLELANDKDVQTFLKSSESYNYIEAIKVGNVSQLKAIIDATGNFTDLKEINLTQFQGDLNALTFENASFIEVLHLRLSEEKLAQLKFLKPLIRLQTLYLYIDGKPQQLQDIQALVDLNFSSLKELHILADLLPKEIDFLVEKLSLFKCIANTWFGCG